MFHGVILVCFSIGFRTVLNRKTVQYCSVFLLEFLRTVLKPDGVILFCFSIGFRTVLMV